MAKHFHVLWAVDTTEQRKPLQMKAAEALRVLLRGLDADVEPVAVVSPDQLRIPADLFHPHSAQHRSEVERMLTAWAAEANLTQVRTPKVLLQDEFSVHRSATRLLTHAQETGATLIAMGTSARTGLARAVLGSFAENLALHSEIPLFVVNPETRPLKAITRVLFPTDFGQACRTAIETLLPVAAAKGAKITFFHKFDYIVPETRNLFEQSQPHRSYHEQDLAQKRHTADEWKAVAAAAGVQADAEFDESSAYVPDAILAAAQTMPDTMIAMASQRGKSAMLLGSVTRDLLRRSPDPVWVIHPHQPPAQ